MGKVLLRSWTLWTLTGVVALALGFTGIELKREFSRARAVRAEVEQSHQARRSLQRTFSLMQDAETGQRGYLIVGETSFLQPYFDALAHLDPQMDELQRLYAEQPSQADDLRILQALVVDKREIMRQTLLVRDTTGREAGLQAVATGRGKFVMDQIRVVVDRMAERDARALAEVTARVDAQSRVTERLTTLVFVSLILVVAISVWLFLRYVRARRSLLQDVRAAASRQEAIFDSAIDAIITLNPSGTLETMNAAAVRMFGWTSEELGRRDISVLLKPDDQSPDALTNWIRSAAIAASGGLVREAHGRRRGGDSFPVDVAFSPMPLPGGVHIVAVIRDISERRRVEQLKQQFVSTVSHELRTPLTSIAGSLGLLVGGAGGALPDKAARLIGIAHANSQRLVRLINDILDVEKLESGQMLLAAAALDMRNVAQRSLDSVAGLADGLGVHIRLEDGPPGPVMGDADRLVQVVVNLLSNAAKFSPAGGIVNVQVMPEARIVRLSVRDKGPGIPDEFRARIFTKFAQADGSDTRQRGGTGLGLAIAKEIAERHGGRLWFESALGEGATFHLDLPLASDETTSPGATEGPRLLVVEDDRDAAEVLRTMLMQDGFDAQVAASAAEALEIVRGETFAAILVDLQLPDADGIALIRTLREQPETMNTPVVVVTADVARGRARGRALEVVDWLEKPFDQDRLRSAIGSLLSRLGQRRPIILHVDDDPDILQVTASALSGIATMAGAASLAEARASLERSRPDLVILDLGLPDGSGLELLPSLGEGDKTIPVVVYSAQEMDAVLGPRVEAVLVKSSASLAHLMRTVRRLTFNTAPANGERP